MKKKLLAFLMTMVVGSSCLLSASAINCVSIQRTSSVSNAVVPDDVEQGIWYWNAAKYVLDYNLMDLTNGCFLGDTKMTREQVAETLYRDYMLRHTTTTPVAKGNNAQNAPDYTQVSMKHRDAISYCYSAGIMTGDANGALHPLSYVTRQELATLLMRYGLIIEYGSAADANSNAVDFYKDAENISSWARGAISYCKITDLCKGDDLGNFNPQSPISHAEFAQILLNLDNKIYAIWNRLS